MNAVNERVHRFLCLATGSPFRHQSHIVPLIGLVDLNITTTRHQLDHVGLIIIIIIEAMVTTIISVAIATTIITATISCTVCIAAIPIAVTSPTLAGLRWWCGLDSKGREHDVRDVVVQHPLHALLQHRVSLLRTLLTMRHDDRQHSC